MTRNGELRKYPFELPPSVAPSAEAKMSPARSASYSFRRGRKPTPACCPYVRTPTRSAGFPVLTGQQRVRQGRRPGLDPDKPCKSLPISVYYRVEANTSRSGERGTALAVNKRRASAKARDPLPRVAPTESVETLTATRFISLWKTTASGPSGSLRQNPCKSLPISVQYTLESKIL